MRLTKASQRLATLCALSSHSTCSPSLKNAKPQSNPQVPAAHTALPRAETCGCGAAEVTSPGPPWREVTAFGTVRRRSSRISQTVLGQTWGEGRGLLCRTGGEMALLSPCLCHLHGDDLLSPQMTPAEVTVAHAATSQAGLPGATAEPSLPCEAPELLGTAHALPTAALRSRSTTRSGD